MCHHRLWHFSEIETEKKREGKSITLNEINCNEKAMYFTRVGHEKKRNESRLRYEIIESEKKKTQCSSWKEERYSK